MTGKRGKNQFVAFLRGINVGGHHKVPMAELRAELAKLGLEEISTILNSGNIIFKAEIANQEELQERISRHLSSCFQFPIPVVVRQANSILELYKSDPFKNIVVTDDIRLYVSFLKKDIPPVLSPPQINQDNAFRIVDTTDKMILSVLDISISKTPKAMLALEKTYGKGITTRNWKTIERIIKKI